MFTRTSWKHRNGKLSLGWNGPSPHTNFSTSIFNYPPPPTLTRLWRHIDEVRVQGFWRACCSPPTIYRGRAGDGKPAWRRRHVFLGGDEEGRGGRWERTRMTAPHLWGEEEGRAVVGGRAMPPLGTGCRRGTERRLWAGACADEMWIRWWWWIRLGSVGPSDFDAMIKNSWGRPIFHLSEW